MLKGSLAALVTPMQPDGQIDYDALQRLVEFHVEQGTHGLVAVGTTGESPTLSHEEHYQVVKKVVEFAAGRLPVIAGTGSNATREACDFTRQAQQSGATAGLAVTPYYNKPTQQGLYQHFIALAESADLPTILYNVPARTGVDLSPKTVMALAEHPRIIGIKEASGRVERIEQLKEQLANDFLVFSGDDHLAATAMHRGADGVISVTANVAPKWMRRLCDAALANDFRQAMATDTRLQPLHRALFAESNPIAVKWALSRMGLIHGTLRLPLTPLSKKYHAPVEQALREVNCL